MKTTLTLKERRFLDAFLGSAGGNGTQACRLAGYKGSEGVLAVTASRLLRKPKLAAAIAVRVRRQSKQAILTADERDLELSRIATAGTDANRIQAIREMNKCGGRHSIKHVIDGKLTLEQILSESRK